MEAERIGNDGSVADIMARADHVRFASLGDRKSGHRSRKLKSDNGQLPKSVTSVVEARLDHQSPIAALPQLSLGPLSSGRYAHRGIVNREVISVWTHFEVSLVQRNYSRVVADGHDCRVR